MIDLHAIIMGYQCFASVDQYAFELNLMDWSGRQKDVQDIDNLIVFLNLVKSTYVALQTVPTETVHQTHEAQPQPSSIAAAVDEAIAEESTPAPEWTEAATTEEMQSRAADSYDLFDDEYWEDEEGFWYDGYYNRYGGDEEHGDEELGF